MVILGAIIVAAMAASLGVNLICNLWRYFKSSRGLVKHDSEKKERGR